MTHPTPDFSAQRRRFLRSGAALASALGVGSLANLLASPAPAHAGDYKALVCIFLYGGNDGLNTIVPIDGGRYAQYSAVRGDLALPRGSLMPLSGSNYGLHPALSALAGAWGAGQLAPVFNVGPLRKAVTKAQFRAAVAALDTSVVPDNLFSHSDQQLSWESSSTHANERTGWGGRAADVLATANPVISVGGTGRFGLSSTHVPLVLPGPGAEFGALGLQPGDLSQQMFSTRKTAIDAMYAAAQDTDLADAYAQMQRDAFDTSQRLGGLIKVQPGSADAVAAIDAAFAPLISNGTLTTGLGGQLYQVAKMIAANSTVQGNRQLFFAQLDGFDTHGNQVVRGSPADGVHADLLKQLGDALAAFNLAMNSMGFGDAVTTFTQSEFGRAFAPNDSYGTDHGWGNQHLVMGGAVKGGATYGTYPDLTLGGTDDIGQEAWELQGRWLPTTAVDQYAATLLRWFGASDTQLDTILPNLQAFGSARSLGFV